MAAADSNRALGVHRSEALSDGIYAVAMTLLVIDLKLPGPIRTQHELFQGLIDLLPHFEAWILSFCVLGLFWFGQHRAYSQLRHTNGRLITLNVAQLGCVTLVPFCSDLLGRSALPLAQAVYSLNLALLGLLSMWVGRYIYRHPELTLTPIPRSAFRGAQFRIIGLVVISIAVVPLAIVLHGSANWAFLLMAVINPLSHRIERAAEPSHPGA